LRQAPTLLETGGQTIISGRQIVIGTPMRLLLIIILILLVLGGGFGLHGGMFIGPHGLYYGGGLGVVILVVLVLLIL